MDIIRIKTLPNGERRGTLVSSEYESKMKTEYHDDNEYAQSLIYSMNSKDVSLSDVEMLEDGDYNIELFARVYTAASFVPEGQRPPTMSNEDHYRYLKND